MCEPASWEARRLAEDTGIKLTSVATRLLGVSGRAMLDALVAGTTDPEVLADFARGKLRKKRQALVSHFCAHHACLVSQLLAHLDYLAEAIETVSTQIDGVMAPFAKALARLDTIRGVNKRTAEVLIAELGVDMRSSPPPSTPPAGPASAPATTRAQAGTVPAGPAMATAGSAPR